MTPSAVLAGRIAAALAHHEPGWRLPRLTTLARRYQASTREIETAIGELVSRHLVRRLPDGQFYRASPAEYQLMLEGISGLSSHLDPMGGQLTCTSHHASGRRVAEGIARVLGLAPGETVLVIKCLWEVEGEPGALSASYIPEQFAVPRQAGEPGAAPPGRADAGQPGRADAGQPNPFTLRAGVAGARPSALQIEMGPPPPSAARRLRVSAGEPVITVTATFAGLTGGPPVALTSAMLRPELFRIVVEAAAGPGGLATAWTRDADCWES